MFKKLLKRWMGGWGTVPQNISDNNLVLSSGNSTGVPITEFTALNLSAVWCATRIIAGTLAGCELALNKRTGGGKNRATKHPTYGLTTRNCNPEMTVFVLKETMMAHLLTWGMCYAEIVRRNNGRPAELWPIPPNVIRPVRNKTDNRLMYEFRTLTKHVLFEADQILCIPGLSFDGIMAHSVVWTARQSLALTAAAEKYGASFFGNSARPGGVLKYPGRLSQIARDNIKKDWAYDHQGSANPARLAVLEEGMEFQAIGLPPEDSQFLETRQFQLDEISRWFVIPSAYLFNLQRATWGNFEQQQQVFLENCLIPWFKKWEQECNRKLLLPSEQEDYFFQFDYSQILAGTPEDRFKVYDLGVKNHITLPNECREREGLNPIEGGDEFPDEQAPELDEVAPQDQPDNPNPIGEGTDEQPNLVL